MIEVPKDLIKLAAGGDHAAFEDIYKLTSSYVYAVALRISGNREDAQEVVQDVFVSLYRNLWKFNFKSKLTTWMYRITVNAAINFYNKAKKKKFREVASEMLVDNRGTPPDAEADMDREANERTVSLMLRMLNVDQRACIVLREIEGLSYEEISRVMKVNINTVRTRLKRARERLMEYMLEKEDTDEM